jgi:hypothetical protein
MKTRSQTKYKNSTLFEVNIDFDSASEAWKANKKSIGNGMYKYVFEKKEKREENDICLSDGETYCKTRSQFAKKKSN